MRAHVQRVSRAEVRVDGEVVGSIDAGLCAFVGVTHTDDAAIAARMAEKLWHLRIFDDEQANMGRSVADGTQQVLVRVQLQFRQTRPTWCNKQSRTKSVCDLYIYGLFAMMTSSLSRHNIRARSTCG